MGYSRVGILLLLSGLALAQQGSETEPSSACQLVSRFKTYRKYFYQYSTESRNGIVGTANLRNGPKVTCKVEIEVPQACSFVMHTTDCAVSEVSDMDPEGAPVYSPAPGSEAFKAAMEKNPLKFTVEDAQDVMLFSVDDEPVNILNIKRGIVSMLLSPNAEESTSVMSTVHGQCRTAHQMNGADLSVTRDLSKCDQFYGRKLTDSPLALLKNLHYPLSKLFTSSQECNYQFDNKGKHITSVQCTEKHVYLPFSNKDNGMSSVIAQELSFQNSKRINNRLFDLTDTLGQPLYFADPDHKSLIQTKESAVNILNELLTLPGTDQSQKRTSLFYNLVSTMRALQNETLSETVTEMLDISTWVTWQALFQCGTAECTSAMLQSIWKINGVSAEVDAFVYALGLKTDPTSAHLRDMLSTAQYRQSKGIMYALGYTVKNFYRGDVTPEIRDVAVFMEEMLNQCSGELGPNMDPDVIRNPEELSYLVLRVIGVMGQPMQDLSPSLVSAVLSCANKIDAPLSTQKAAIQAFRNININDEVRSALLEIYQDAQSPVEKRVAAYHILIKNMDEATARTIVNSVEDLTDQELKIFVVTHLNNVLKNDLHATYYIELAVRDKELPPLDELYGKSRNFMSEVYGASFKSNIVFDDANTLPKDVSLDLSHDKDYMNKNLFKLNLEGDGFEPVIKALFGESGFVPESFFKLTNWGQELISGLRSEDGRMKRQVPDDLVKSLSEGFQKLMEDLRSSETPEAVAYFELLGTEMGYMKISQIRDVLETMSMYQHIFLRVLPTSAFFKLTSSADNDIFAHYIFMDNSFSLPTISGMPLKFSLSGVFAPGAKGGLTYAPNMGSLSFMPSVGVEFITNMGVHIPDYVEAGMEMHTDMFHESSINAKISWDRNQIKLTLPAPTVNTQLFSVSNKVLSLSTGKTKIVPSLVEDRTDSTDCQPLITGLRLCSITQFSNGSSTEHAPYYPLTGESRFAIEIQPTGEVSEYVASLTREMLKEGKDRVTALKISLKAEGVDSAELAASLKYNMNKNTVLTEFNIPDYDIEAGVKFALSSDPRAPELRGITIDVTNKNIPQLSLIARTRLEMMKDAMLQLQMTLPSLNADASITSTLNIDDIITVDTETVVNLPETLYQHKVSLKYDDDKIELELKTDANSDLQKLIPNAEDHHRHLQQLLDEMLDQRVAKTDMKLRHIVSKGIEAVNIWMDKLTAQFPYLENLRSKRSVSDLTLPPLPEKLFFQYDGLFRYQFNKDRLLLSLPLPLGGKTSQELDFPEQVTYPAIDLPKIGLHLPPLTVKLPPFTIPPSWDFSLPLLGLAEVSAKINSNIYSWEGSVSGGNNTVDVPSYMAHYKIMAQSPFCVLSYKLEGTGMVTGRADDSMKYLLSNTFNHCLIDTSLSVVRNFALPDKINAKADYKLEISSPVGFELSWFYTAQATSTPDQEEVSGDGTVDGKLKLGSYNSDITYTQSYNLRPLDREGRGESSLVLNCPLGKFNNIIQGRYADSELLISSRTTALDDALKHTAELKFKDAQLMLKCNGMGTGMGKVLSNKMEIGISDQMALFRAESQIDDGKDKVYSLLTWSLDSNKLEANSEGSLIFELGRGLHKASLMINKDGLVISGTNAIECSPVTIENIFNGVIDSNGAMMSTKTKAIGEEGRGELNIDGQVTSSEATLQGVLKGHAFDGTTRNNVNILVNRNGLTLNADTMGSMKQMKVENNHQLAVTLWTVNLRSKSNNFICEDVYYKQDTKVNMQPFVATIDMTNDLKFYELSLNNEGHAKLRPTNLDLSGSVMGAYGDDNNFKHIYEVNFAGLEGALKYTTSAQAMDAQLSHKCEFEFAGLSSTTKCEARVNSQPLRLDSTVKVMALPFSLSIDGLVNSDGEIKLHGKHTGQLYSRFLFKGEPLSLAYAYDHRFSTTHKPRRMEEITTNLDSKLEGLLTPNNQVLNWKLKSKLNNHAYNFDFITYNNPENIGAEFSGVALTNLLSKLTKDSPVEEEFSMSGFLKYDKNTECHIIELPFIESFPAAFEQVKTTLVQALESLYKYIEDLDINMVISDFKNWLSELPKKVGDFMKKYDLENYIAIVNEKIDYLMNEFSITLEDVEKAVLNLKANLEETVTDIATKIKELLTTLKDFVESGQLRDKITNVLKEIGDHVWAFDEKYEIKLSLVKLLDAIEDILSQINLQKLTESSTAWLKDLDEKYSVMDKIKDKLSEIKQAIEDFDIQKFFEDLKEYILSIDLAAYLDQFEYSIPYSDIKRTLENMNDVIANWIDEYEIPQKLNAVYNYIKDQILKYNLDEKFKELLDQLDVLIDDLKIEETLQIIVDSVKKIDFEYAYSKIMDFLEHITNALKEIDFKRVIENLNDNIANLVKSMKEFDYHMFVDETNQKIAELADYINEQIKLYEIVEKIEAVREFFKEVQNSVYNYLDELKNTKIADALVRLKDVIDSTFYNDVKLKTLDILDDVRQRISDMDVINEITVHLQRASEFYKNTVELITTKLTELIDEIAKWFKNSDFADKVKTAVDEAFSAIKEAEIKVPMFSIPLTDLVIPEISFNLNKLDEISIPSEITTPEITILNTYTIPSYTIDFEMVKAKIVEFIDELKMFEIQWPDPHEIFGDLKVLYLFDLPDLTFPEITLSEVKVPSITIPKINLEAFEITMLPFPPIEMPEIPSDICIPVFGKLYGEFRLNSPQYSLITRGNIENATTTLKNPIFTASLNSQATSTYKPLEYILEVDAKLEAPKLKKMLFTETVKVTHMAFSVDHEGVLTLTSSSAEANARTNAKATTPLYTADLMNNIMLSLKGGIYATCDTMYNHNLDLPSLEFSSQANVKHTGATTLESGKVSVTGETNANCKWSIDDYSDEGTHKNKLDFNVDLSTAKLMYDAETDAKCFKSKESLTVESVVLNHVTITARNEMDIPSLKKSTSALDAEANIDDLKLAITATHNCEYTGSVQGTEASTLDFKIHPFEIILDAKNKANLKIFLPLKLTGKVDFQNDYCLILNSEKQKACWLALARFNQYKYNHNCVLENNDKEIYLHKMINAEANLDFLTVPLSIPEMTIPYFEKNTPAITDFSLWDHAGLKYLLHTPQQSFDFTLKLHYFKNPEPHILELNLEPYNNAIRDNANLIQEQFEMLKDKIVGLLKESHSQVKKRYVKHKKDTSSMPPRIITIPGYKIPVLNIEVSSFSAELPAFSYVVPKEVSTPSFKVPALGFSVPSYTLVLPSLELPIVHIPETLSKIEMPTFTFPDLPNNIEIPALGNFTLDFSFKSAVIAVSANGELVNQQDIVARFAANSASVFETLNTKIDGMTSLTRKRGIKLATTINLEQQNLLVNHECAISLSKISIISSIGNNVKINMPFLKLEFDQAIEGNTQTTPTVSATNKLKYMFNIPVINSAGKGSYDIRSELETLRSHISMDTSTQGKSDITIMDEWNIVHDLDNKATFYLNVNGLRTTVRTSVNSDVEKQEKLKRSTGEKVVHFDAVENFALEITLRRMFATLDFKSKNNANFEIFNTNGDHVGTAELDLVPLKSLKTKVDIDLKQPSSLGHMGFIRNINLEITSEKQSLSWIAKEQIASFIHGCNVIMTSEESEARVDLSESMEGHLAFLKSVRIPVYQKNLWDVLKLDQVTNMDDLQVLNISSSFVYTKSMDGQEYGLSYRLFEDGVMLIIPGFTVPVPYFLTEIPAAIRKIDMRLEEIEIPDYVTFPPVLSVPEFSLPFTNLHVEPFVYDLKQLEIPKVITTKAFDIMIPGLPIISVPSYEINVEYLQEKMSFLSVKIPQYNVMVSFFALPKSVRIGDLTIDLDDVKNYISNFELPTIVIPEQTIEIPEMDLYLPTSIFIPNFGALSATFKVASPIYNVSTTAEVEKRGSNLITGLKSICMSTMIFLEYDLTASATAGFNDKMFNLKGNIDFVHSDVNVKWQHNFLRTPRMKRQTSTSDPYVYSHTLTVDITSPLFADVGYRMAARKDGVTASVSSPTNGFLGFQLQRRSPSQVFGKVFIRYLATPEKDTDLLTFKATLRNSEKLSLQSSFNIDTLRDVMEATKERIPALNEAILKVINKYHISHFGFDLNRGGMKLKNTLSNAVERAYYEFPVSFDGLQNTIEQMSDKGVDMYKKASDDLMSFNLQDFVDKVEEKLLNIMNFLWTQITELEPKFHLYLRELQITIPGYEKQISGVDISEKIRAVSEQITEMVIQRFLELLDIIERIKEIEFTIPGTDIFVSGEEILKQLNHYKRQINNAFTDWSNKFNELFKLIVEKGQDFINYLSNENKKIAPKIENVFVELKQSSKEQTGKASGVIAEYKDSTKEVIHNLYISFEMDNVNKEVKDFVGFLQTKVHSGLKNGIEFMSKASESTAPYVKMTGKRVEIEIPLPFLWKSFSEWPTLPREWFDTDASM
ncbi:LOW QUALITY PROTEIN: apolipoprotein B-100 [Boleophthalmus pectinirostris]|uniref:LOW QUALITY PROTEIN: apolipoprotein B-100 n=1 Tax=Boleophthalmus pectinirostris TaxID=150288 RepID=UPI002430516B|nr:LOW QUALITY PROTEIN: apolipoprotein B-100 [Boleophthalmus pectinirostris]